MQRSLLAAGAAILMFSLPAAADSVTPTPGTGDVYSDTYSRTYRAYWCGRHGWRGSYHCHYTSTTTTDQDGAAPLEEGTYTAHSGRATSTTTYSTTEDGELRFDFSHSIAHGGSSYDNARAVSTGRVYFDVQEGYTVDYDMSGLYTASQLGYRDSIRAVTQLVRIDEGGNEVVVHDSDYTHLSGQALTLDVVDQGSPTGTLGAGTYFFNFSRQLYEYNGQAASASGYLLLGLNNETQINAVPEPGTWALLGLAGLALLGGVRRKK